jgi:hypothetical protein
MHYCTDIRIQARHHIAYRHLYNPPSSNPLHSSKHAASTTTLPALCLSLHLLANLDIDLEELGDAAV